MAIAKQVTSRDGKYVAYFTQKGIIVYYIGSSTAELYENSYKFGETIYAVYLPPTEIHNIRKFASDHWPIDNVVNIKS